MDFSKPGFAIGRAALIALAHASATCTPPPRPPHTLYSTFPRRVAGLPGLRLCARSRRTQPQRLDATFWRWHAAPLRPGRARNIVRLSSWAALRKVSDDGAASALRACEA